jgi:AcrR family transcriptional regulator
MSVAERRFREKEARRRQILDAARVVFQEKGFAETTIEEIAEKTELSKGTLYLYFPSKEEIYFSLMLEGSAILYEMLKDAAQADLPADTRLRRLGGAYLKFYREYTGYFRMLFLYYSSTSWQEKLTAQLCAQCEAQAKQSLDLVASLISQGIEQGLFRQCNPWETSILFWTAHNGIILLGEKGDDRTLDLGTSIEKLQDLFVESMIISLKAGR